MPSVSHHGFVHVQRLAVAPRFEHALHCNSTMICAYAVIFLMKSRLDELALPPPEIAFAEEQAIAQHAAHGAVIFRFHEIIVLRNQDGLDVLRPAHITGGHAQKTKKYDVSVLARAFVR